MPREMGRVSLVVALEGLDDRALRAFFFRDLAALRVRRLTLRPTFFAVLRPRRTAFLRLFPTFLVCRRTAFWAFFVAFRARFVSF